jgi:hypothetical protein
MPLICDFIGALAVAGKSFKKIQETVKNIHSDKASKKTQLYEIKVKEGKSGRPTRVTSTGRDQESGVHR